MSNPNVFYHSGRESNIEWKSIAYTNGVLWGLDKDDQLLSRSKNIMIINYSIIIIVVEHNDHQPKHHR